MSIVNQVLGAKTSKDAMVSIASALDRIEAKLNSQPAVEDWDSWSPPEAPIMELPAVDPARGGSTAATEDDVVFESVGEDSERYKQRETFATHSLNLNDPALIKAYAAAGARWFLAHDYKLAASYSRPVRQALIDDIREDDPELAHLQGAALLAYPTSGGVMSGVQVANG